MAIVRVLSYAAVHLALALATAFVARGWDLDQVSRTPVSKVAEMLHTALMLPHDAFIRALSTEWLVRLEPLLTAAVFVNSFLYGAAAFAAWSCLRATARRRTSH
jgi:hypothetical protein